MMAKPLESDLIEIAEFKATKNCQETNEELMDFEFNVTLDKNLRAKGHAFTPNSFGPQDNIRPTQTFGKGPSQGWKRKSREVHLSGEGPTKSVLTLGKRKEITAEVVLITHNSRIKKQKQLKTGDGGDLGPVLGETINSLAEADSQPRHPQ